MVTNVDHEHGGDVPCATSQSEGEDAAEELGDC